MNLNFGEIKLAVARKCNDISDDGKSIAGECINQAIEMIDETHFWSFFKNNKQSIPLVAGQGDYDLPDDFTHLVKLWYYDDGYQILRPSDDDESYRYGSETPGTPELFRLIGKRTDSVAGPQLQITPVPSVDFVTDHPLLELEMTEGFDVLADDDEYPAFPDRFSKVIEWYASSLMAAGQGDYNAQKAFEGTFGAMLSAKVQQDQKRYEDTVYIPTGGRMTFGELKWAVAFMVGDTSARGQAIAGNCVNQIQLRIQRKRNWSFLTDLSADITLEAGVGEYELSDDFFSIKRPYYNNLDGSFITIDPAEDYRYFRYINESDPDTPYLYRLVSMGDNRKLKIQLGPPPSSTFISRFGDLHIEQIAQASQLTEDTDYTSWPDDFRTCIEYGAAMLMGTQTGGDREKISQFGLFFQSELNDLSFDDSYRYNKAFAFRPEPGQTPRPWSGVRRGDYGRIR